MAHYLLTDRGKQTNGSQTWRTRVDELTKATLRDFFPNDTAFEMPCEGRRGSCTADMLSFKGYVHRWLSVVSQVAPFTRDDILPVLRTSATAAVAQCTGGETGRKCGFYWSSGQFVDPSTDRTSGAGEQMSVLAAVSSLLIEDADPPATNKTGGISKGNPNAGSEGGPREHGSITTGDRAGAGILTMILLGSALGMWGWMSID